MSNPNKVVVPVDFGDQSLIALEQAANVATMMSGDITLLYVVESGGILSRFKSNEVDEEMKKEIHSKMDELIAAISSKNVKVDKLIAQGSVYEKVAEVAEMLNARFIV